MTPDMIERLARACDQPDVPVGWPGAFGAIAIVAMMCATIGFAFYVHRPARWE